AGGELPAALPAWAAVHVAVGGVGAGGPAPAYESRIRRSRLSRSLTSCGATPAVTSYALSLVSRTAGSPSGVPLRPITLATRGSLARRPRRNTTATSALASRT